MKRERRDDNRKDERKDKKPVKDVPFILPEDKKALSDLEHKRESAEKEIVSIVIIFDLI